MINRMRPTIRPIKGMFLTSSKSAASSPYVLYATNNRVVKSGVGKPVVSRLPRVLKYSPSCREGFLEYSLAYTRIPGIGGRPTV
jgi:hypothetical protein